MTNLNVRGETLETQTSTEPCFFYLSFTLGGLSVELRSRADAEPCARGAKANINTDAGASTWTGGANGYCYAYSDCCRSEQVKAYNGQACRAGRATGQTVASCCW